MTDSEYTSVWQEKDPDADQRYKMDARIMEMLKAVNRSGDELAGWFVLQFMREILCLAPANKDVCQAPFPQTMYLECFCWLVDDLNQSKFCLACNALIEMIIAGCLAYAGIRNVILYTLFTHENLQFRKQYDLIDTQKYS